MRRPKRRTVLTAVAILLGLESCDYVLGPNLLLTTIDTRVREPLVDRFVHLGETRSEVYRTIALTGATAHSAEGNTPWPSPRGRGAPTVWVDYFHLSMFCVSTWTREIFEFDAHDRLVRMTSEDGHDSC